MRLNRFFLPFILCLVLGGAFATAQAPRRISYQGLLADDNGVTVPNGGYTLMFKVFDGQTAGSKLWEESHSVEVKNGLFNVMLGDKTPLDLPFDKPYWIEIEVNGTTLFARTPLSSAPYSLYAQTVPDNSVTAAKLSANGGVNGQVLKINNNRVEWGTVSGGGGGGSITGVLPGPGLKGGGVSGTVTLEVDNGGITTGMIATGAITQEKLAANLGLPPGGAAGGDLAGDYPNPTIVGNAITTNKLQNDAVTTDKIADGTIVGADINANTAVLVGSVQAKTNVTIGNPLAANPAPRLAIQGSGTTAGSYGVHVTNSANATTFAVRDDGTVGIGTAGPAARLEIGGPATPIGLMVSTGTSVFSSVSVPAGPAIAMPGNVTMVQVLNDGAVFPNNVVMPVAATPGQILIIVNDDLQALAGQITVAPGQTRMYVYAPNPALVPPAIPWRLIN